MSVEIDGEFSGYLYTIFTYQEGLEDPEVFSDNLLIDNLYNVGATWSPAYFRGEWDVEMMIAAVAFDMDGNPSPVYRERFICTRDGAGDAQEFVDYYLGEITRTMIAKDAALNIANAPSQRVATKQMCLDKGMRFSVM
jgi:hypothetical protein